MRRARAFRASRVNAIQFLTAPLAETLSGKGSVEIKNAMVAQAVVYVQKHGADTMKQLRHRPDESRCYRGHQGSNRNGDR